MSWISKMIRQKEKVRVQQKKRQKKIRYYIPMFLCVLLITSLFVWFDWLHVRKYLGLRPPAKCSTEKQVNRKPEVGSCAPNFQLVDQNGEQYELYENDQKPTVLYFWNYHCPECNQELHDINKMVHKYGKQVNFLILHATAIETDLKGAKTYITQQKYGFPFFSEPKKPSISLDLYHISGTPTTFIIDQDGKIIHKIMGAYFQLSFENLLKEVLDK